MKAIFLTLIILLFWTAVLAQEPPAWARVYTFDESVIEMNTSKVTFGGKDIARVSFRCAFDRPEAVSGKTQLKIQEPDRGNRIQSPGKALSVL